MSSIIPEGEEPVEVEFAQSQMSRPTPAGDSVALPAERERWRIYCGAISLLVVIASAALIITALQPNRPGPPGSEAALGPGLSLFRRSEVNAKFHHSNLPVTLHDVWFVDASRGWAVGNQGVILATVDGGRTWSEQRAEPGVVLRAVHFVDAQHGWAVAGRPDPSDDVQATSGIARDTAQGVANAFQGAAPQNTKQRVARRGLFVPQVLATTNGGKTWSAQLLPQAIALYDVRFVNSRQGWAVGEDGMIIATSDGGANWREQTSGVTENLLAAYFLDERRGRVMGENGVVLTTADGGVRWTHRDLRVDGKATVTLRSLAFVDENHGWVAGDGGMIWRTTDGGATWVAQAGQRSLSVVGIQFADASRGWIASREGAIWTTTNGGAAWTTQLSAPGEWLQAMHFADAQRGWVVGGVKRTTILATEDGGKTWSRQEPPRYRAWPPGIWIITAGLGLAGLLVSVLTPGADRRGTWTWIDSRFFSDAPLTDPKDAPEWMRRLVRGLANYLHNPATAAPVTLAITGAWGRGKSSVMNLLRAESIRNGHRPVWFNAWHHQDAENVLAALLGAIREQAIPPWISFPEHPPYVTFDGALYRLRLIGLRARRAPMHVLLLAGLSAFSISWLVLNWSALAHNWSQLLRSDVSAQADDLMEILKSLLAAGGGLLPLFNLMRLLRAFGVDPSKLLAVTKDGNRSADLEARNLFRTRFATEFEDVTAALGKTRRMVIFIDDLDRCSADQLLKVLEATNFLNSSGECFVVLGMQRETVLACLKEQLTEAQLGPEKDPARWLEKLVQINVDVPRSDQELEARLKKTEARAPEKRTGKIWRAACLASLAAAVFAGLIWAGISIGGSATLRLKTIAATMTREERPSPPVMQLPPQRSPSDAGEGVAPVAPLPDASSEIEPLPPPPAEIAPANARAMRGGVLAAIAAGVGLLIVAVNRRYRARIETKDSPAFVAAWNDWQIVVARETPRERNRLRNLVRFDAMLIRALGDGALATQAAEAHIVTLAVLEKMFPEVLQLRQPGAVDWRLICGSRESGAVLQRRATQALEALDRDKAFATFRYFKEAVGLNRPSPVQA